MRWLPDEDTIVRALWETRSAAQIGSMIERSAGAVEQRARRLGLRKTENRGQFRKGQTPHNKGARRPGWSKGRMAETQFKPRAPNEARNYQPIGTERFDPERGLMIRKVTDDRALYPAARWRPVHVLVWEAAHGPVPAGHLVRFREGMKTLDTAAITVDRLELLSRAENLQRNSLYRYPKEVVDAIKMRGALRRVINNRKRETHP